MVKLAPVTMGLCFGAFDGRNITYRFTLDGSVDYGYAAQGPPLADAFSNYNEITSLPWTLGPCDASAGRGHGRVNYNRAEASRKDTPPRCNEKMCRRNVFDKFSRGQICPLRGETVIGGQFCVVQRRVCW